MPEARRIANAAERRGPRTLKRMFRERLPLLDAKDLALLRGRIEGLGAVDAWYRFGDSQHDGRGAQQRLERVIDDIVVLARAHGLDEIAASFARQAAEHFAQVDAKAADAESAPERKARLQRSRRRREALVTALDAVLAKPARDPVVPFLADPVELWLLCQLPTWLRHARAFTLEDLGRVMRIKGHHWHVAVPHLGPEKAVRIVRWWQDRGEWLGYLPSTVVLPRAQIVSGGFQPKPTTAVVPIERFVMPHDDRSGANGTNRADRSRCQLQAGNDYEAIQAWLSRKREGSHTWRAYRREAERFLLWSVLERRKAMSSLTFEDCIAYREFLRAPAPDWVRLSDAQVERFSPYWRPFAGPLGAESLKTAVVILRALSQFLKDVNYLDANPWAGVPMELPQRDRSRDRARSLPEDVWSRVEDWLVDELANPPGAATRRLQFIVRLAYTTGLRLSELAASRVAHLHTLVDAGERFWMLNVIGKGGKERDVPAPDSTVESLRAYLGDRGLRRDLVETYVPTDGDVPLIAHIESETPLSAARIYDVLKDAFARCAALTSTTDLKAANLLQQASTHWLRHTYGTHATARGVELSITMGNMGHASLTTTSRYVTAEEGKRARAVRKAFG